MKKKFFFLPLLAALALTGCSNDDDFILDEGTGNGSGEGNGAYGYVAVNIAQTISDGGRASDTGFELGSDDENYAKSGLFFIFDSNGDIVGNAQDIVLDKADNQPTDGNIEKIYKAVLVIDGATYDEEHPKPADDALSIVCILNAPEETAGEGVTLLRQCTKLSELTEKFADYCTGYQSSGKFIMTNSVYVQPASGSATESIIIGAPVKAENIKESADAAYNDPVNIYVERVVAKVNAKAADSFSENPTTDITINGATTPTTLTIKTTGIEYANVAESSYLFKNIDGYNNWGDSFSDKWWNDTNNFRSYWGNTKDEMTYANQSYNTIAAASIEEGSDILKKHNLKTDYTLYIQPNTNLGLNSTNTGTNRYTYDKYYKTAVLVTAQLMLDDNTPAHIVYIKGGYFKYENAMTLIADAATTGGYYKAATGATDLDESTVSKLEGTDFVLTQEFNSSLELKDYESVAKLNLTDKKLVKKGVDGKYTDATDADKTALTNLLQKKTNVASEYKNGYCYYYVYLDHTPVANEHKAPDAQLQNEKIEGVVRNHSYKLSLTGIEGLGTPVCDPTLPIIPERAEYDKLSYLAAQVKVLSWKFVNQNVILH